MEKLWTLLYNCAVWASMSSCMWVPASGSRKKKVSSVLCFPEKTKGCSWKLDHPASIDCTTNQGRSLGRGPPCSIPLSLRESLDHSVAAAAFSIPVSSARPSRIDSPSLSSVALASVRVCQATHRRCDGSGGLRGLRGHRPSSRRQPTASQLWASSSPGLLKRPSQSTCCRPPLLTIVLLPYKIGERPSIIGSLILSDFFSGTTTPLAYACMRANSDGGMEPSSKKKSTQPWAKVALFWPFSFSSVIRMHIPN